MSDTFASLLYSRKFWLAVIALAQTIIFNLIPGFPDEVWISINAVLAVVIGGIAVEDAAAKFGASVPPRPEPLLPPTAPAPDERTHTTIYPNQN